MARLFRRRGEDELETELRRARPEPQQEFVSLLSIRLHELRPARRPSFRVALVGALSATVVIALSAVGSLGYAATAVHSGASLATRVIQPAKPKAHAKPNVTRSSAAAPNMTQSPAAAPNVTEPSAAALPSAAAQYGKKVRVCHKGKTISVNQNAVPAHLAHGDTLGKCPPFKPKKAKTASKTGAKPKTTG